MRFRKRNAPLSCIAPPFLGGARGQSCARSATRCVHANAAPSSCITPPFLGGARGQSRRDSEPAETRVNFSRRAPERTLSLSAHPVGCTAPCNPRLSQKPTRDSCDPNGSFSWACTAPRYRRPLSFIQPWEPTPYRPGNSTAIPSRCWCSIETLGPIRHPKEKDRLSSRFLGVSLSATESGRV